MYKSGDTVKLSAKFYNFDDVLTDPDSVTVKIYNRSTRTQIDTGPAIKASVGIYYYYYTLPTDLTGSIVYEFSGTMDTYPVIAREFLPIEWV